MWVLRTCSRLFLAPSLLVISFLVVAGRGIAPQPAFAQTAPSASKSSSKPARKSPSNQKTPPSEEASPDAPANFVLHKIGVDGNTTIAADQVLAVSGLTVDQAVSKADFDAARDRLIATGMFETVGYSYEPDKGSKTPGYQATIQVHEITPLYPVEFVALPVPDADLQKHLQSAVPFYRDRIPATKPVLDMCIKAIEDYLAKVGHPQRVTGKLYTVGTDQFRISFWPAEGMPMISEGRFRGAKAVAPTDLQRMFSEVAYGTPFTEAGVRMLLENQIRPMYEARGYLAVKFGAITTQPSKVSKGLEVLVQVEEGPQYKLAEFSITGVSDDEGRLIKAAGIKPGAAANFEEIHAARDRVTQAARHDGYLDAKTSEERKVSDAKQTVAVKLRVEEGPRYRFQSLVVKGLDLNGEDAIRKMWARKPGDPFNPEYPNHFLSRVKEDGTFEALGETKASFQIVDKNEHTVEVTLQFKGAPPKPDKKPAQVPF